MCTENGRINREQIRENNGKVPVKYDRDKLFDGLSAFIREYALKNGYDVIVSEKLILENGYSFDADIAVGKFEQTDGAYKGTPVFVAEIQPVDVIYAMDLVKVRNLGLNGVKEYWLFNSHIDSFETYILDKEATESGRLYAENRDYAMGSSVCPKSFREDADPINICPADFI